MKLQGWILLVLSFFIDDNFIQAQNWTSAGCGFNSGVNTLYSDSINNILYACGYFQITECDSIVVRRISQFNGVKWDSVGSGFVNPSGPMSAMTNYNGKFYACPIAYNAFTDLVTMGEWNGSNWIPFATTPGSVFNLKVLDNELYAMGTFDSIGGISAQYIAKWNGNEWIDLYFGDYETGGGYGIWDAIIYQGELYVGGLFRDSIDAVNIAKWDGTKWVTVGDGLGKGSIIGVYTLEVYHDELYAGGEFNKANGNPANYIARWDGNQWHEVGGGVSGVLYPSVLDMEVYHDYLYAGGKFKNAGGVPSELVARWDGNEWCSLETDFPEDNYVSALTVHNDTLIIGGSFYWVDSINVHKVAKYIGGEDLGNCGAINSTFEIPQQNISAHPNPFSQSVSISIPCSQDCSLELFNTLGQKASIKYSVSENESRTIFHIDRGNLPSGVYFFQIISEGDIIASGKLVAQ